MSPVGLTEGVLVERPALDLLSGLGWDVVSGFEEVLGSGGTLGRDSQSEPVLGHRLRGSLRGLNPGLSEAVLDAAVERLVGDRSVMGRVRANREVHDLLHEGARVETTGGDGNQQTVTVRFVDWDSVDGNDWLAVSQFWIVGDMYKRRADVVLFVNGIPLVLIELKVSHKNVRDAYDANLRDYRDTVPHLFWFNAFVVLSSGADNPGSVRLLLRGGISLIGRGSTRRVSRASCRWRPLCGVRVSRVGCWIWSRTSLLSRNVRVVW